MEIPGLLSENRCVLLERLVYKINPQKVMEVGCYIGRSTWVFLETLSNTSELHVNDAFWSDSNELSENLRTVLDTDLYKDVIEFVEQGHDQFETWEMIVKQHPRYDEIFSKVYNMPSSEYIKQDVGNNFDLVFLDAGHTYADVKEQLEYFHSCPVICGDDYSDYWTGVRDAVNEYISTTGRYFYLNDEFFIISDSEIKL
jgi:hypothetical protein